MLTNRIRRIAITSSICAVLVATTLPLALARSKRDGGGRENARREIEIVPPGSGLPGSGSGSSLGPDLTMDLSASPSAHPETGRWAIGLEPAHLGNHLSLHNLIVPNHPRETGTDRATGAVPAGGPYELARGAALSAPARRSLKIVRRTK